MTHTLGETSTDVLDKAVTEREMVADPSLSTSWVWLTPEEMIGKEKMESVRGQLTVERGREREIFVCVTHKSSDLTGGALRVESRL